MQTRRRPFRIGIAFPSCARPLQVSDPLPIVDGHADEINPRATPLADAFLDCAQRTIVIALKGHPQL